MIKKQKPKKLVPRRAKVVESKYIEKSDLIQWTLYFLDDGTDQTYVWPSVDLIKELNIKGKVEPSHLHKFCEDILNKEINFSIDKEPERPKEMPKEKFEEIGKRIGEHFDVFKKTIEEEQ